MLAALLRWQVADFGTARLAQAAGSASAAEAFAVNTCGNAGTLLWQAPEVQERHAAYTAAADVYSYGVVLWEVLTRAVPYTTNKFDDPPSAVVLERLIIGGLRPTIPAQSGWAVGDLIERCWDRDAARRPTFFVIVETLQQLEQRGGLMD